MATLYYRAMTETNGKPKIGRSARCLGIRVDPPRRDVDSEQVPENWLDEQGYLKPDFNQKDVRVLVMVLKGFFLKQKNNSLTATKTAAEIWWLHQQGYWNSLDNPVTVVIRNGKGMSTSLSIESLEAHRKPPSFGGTGKDPLWQIDDLCISGDLEALRDSRTHVSIVPRVTMQLERYESALANTQSDWHRVESRE